MYNVPTQDQLDAIPRLNETEHIPIKDKFIHLHFSYCYDDYYVAEYDGEDTFFGYVSIYNGLEAEWKFFSFNELIEFCSGRYEIECDYHWQIKPVSEVENIIL